jgi:hypothetical protein
MWELFDNLHVNVIDAMAVAGPLGAAESRVTLPYEDFDLVLHDVLGFESDAP